MKKALNTYLKTALRAAREAGALQKRALGRAHTIHFKGEINLVTEVDQACEKKIIGILSNAHPGHDILAEEAGMRDRSSEFRWFVDPLDGTTNFAHGYPVFCVSIGLAYRGELVLGVVYDPTREEVFYATKGGGAWLNKRRIHVSKTARLKRSLLSTGFSYDLRKRTNNNFDHFLHFLKTSQAVRRDGAAAIDLCYVACGRYDGFWEMDLWPWDTSAGAVILREAGGKVSDFKWRAFDPYGREILASNGRIHRPMLKGLKGLKKT